MDRREHFLTGGDSGPAIVAGKPEQSLLIKAVRYQSAEMPPTGQLAQTQIALLQKWVALGAPWPMEAPLPAVQTSESKSYDFSRLRDKHWSFHAIQRPTLPSVSRQHWGQNAIDRFVLARLEVAELSPSPPATPPHTLPAYLCRSDRSAASSGRSRRLSKSSSKQSATSNSGPRRPVTLLTTLR